MRKICYYHDADLDGKCSAAIVRKHWPDTELRGIDYGESIAWETIEKEDRVIMVDFSLQPFTEMFRLKEVCNELIWIDHHKTSFEAAKNTLFVCDGLHCNGDKAACELAWEYFFSPQLVPMSVWLLGRYDVWDHTHPWTLPFQYGFRALDTRPTNDRLWRDILNDDPLFQNEITERIMGDGFTVLRYLKQKNADFAKKNAFPIALDGLRFIAMNDPGANSQSFEAVWDTRHFDAMLSFGFSPGSQNWKISLFSEAIDVSEIARARGGGGHKKAAGFMCKKLPWEE